jgi:5-methylcytosine-specific restriction enzyme A
MMARSTPEWIGHSDDSPIPPRVKLRVWNRCIGRCSECTRKILPGMEYEFDHIVALINGGRNTEKNLALLCKLCHLRKSGNDVALKATVYRKRTKHLGIKRKRSSFSTNRDGKFKRKFDGTIVRR